MILPTALFIKEEDETEIGSNADVGLYVFWIWDILNRKGEVLGRKGT